MCLQITSPTFFGNFLPGINIAHNEILNQIVLKAFWAAQDMKWFSSQWCEWCIRSQQQTQGYSVPPYPAVAVHQLVIHPHPPFLCTPLNRGINRQVLLRGPTSSASKELQKSWTFWVVLAWFIKKQEFKIVRFFSSTAFSLKGAEAYALICSLSQAQQLNSLAVHSLAAKSQVLCVALYLVLQPIVCFCQLVIARKGWCLWVWKEVFYHYV